MIPKTATVPAFLFHFIEEYDRLADFDAGVSLAIDLTADILLMYFTGGASALRDLQYLKYTNNIGKALQGSLSATEAVEVWRGLEVGGEIFTVTTGELAHINQYLIATENNEKKKKILEKNQKVLLTLMMAGVGSSVNARSKAVQEADETLRLIDALPVNTPHNIPQSMIDVLTTLSGQKAVTLSLFGNKLNNLELAGAANTIAAKYNLLFTDAQRLKFWNDFQQIDDPAFWKLLNSGKGANGALNGSYIDNWISLSERGLQEAKFTDYICVQRRTDALINYVNEPITKPIINTLSYERKLVFIDTFGNDLTTFKNKPELINQWKKYYDDLALRTDFVSLEVSKQIQFLEKYGDASIEGVKNIRFDPVEHLKHLLNFDEPIHNIKFFYKRRAEMLPPNFKDIGGDGKLYGIQEVDSFIELEIKFGGKARPSSNSEAGDIIMEGGLMNGKSLDPLGLSHKAVQGWKNKFTTNFNRFKISIDRHFAKISIPKDGKPPLDKVVIDLKYMDEVNSTLKQEVLDYIQTNYPQYNNDTFLIKLNL